MSTTRHAAVGLGAGALAAAITLIGLVPTLAQSPAPLPAGSPPASIGVEPAASVAPGCTMAEASPAAGASMAPAASTECPEGIRSEVAIQDFAFQPADLTVTVGTTVVWANDGPSDHTVTADDGSFDSGAITAGSSFANTFDAAGTFTYHCSIHPQMVGTITVA